MNLDDKYIKNENIKIKNLLKIPNAETYNGNCELYDFRNQKSNFENFKNKIIKLGIYPTTLYGAVWRINTLRHSFLIQTSNPNLLWYRYDTDSFGGSQNYIYIKKQKIKLTNFLVMTDDQIINLLN